jgi:DNA (cytosine-5)-methyltransferase 1
MALDTTGAQVVAYQCQGTNVGEMGTLRAGNGHVTGGVPFVFDERNVTSKANRSIVRLDGPSPTLHEAGSMTLAHTLRAEGADASEDGTGRGVPIVAFDWQTGAPKEGKGRVYGVRKGEYAGALGTSKQDAISQGMAIRRLMPVECLRLQGLPDDWLDLDPPLSDSVKYRLIGNSVARRVVEWIARRLLAMEAE